MKFLVLAAALFVGWLLWRKPRSVRAARATPQAPAHEMVQCSVCSVHLPRGEAVADGQGRLFCSAEHRLASSR